MYDEEKCVFEVDVFCYLSDIYETMKGFLSYLKAWSSMSLMLRIFIGLVIGACLGLFCPQFVSVGMLGEMFVGALKAIAPVLVAVLVAASIAKAKGGLGKRFKTVITLYVLTTLLAAVVAVVGSFIFPVTIDLKEVQIDAEPVELSDVFSNLLTNMVTNPFHAVASANYLGILFWSVIIGLGLKLKANEKTINVVNDFSEVVSKIVGWIIQFAPFGIMGLVFNSVSQSGLDIFTDYGRLLLLLLGCMFFVSLVLNPIIVALYLRCNPYPLVFRCLKESGLSALFTRSSAANIPVNMALCNKLGLDKDFYSVSIPLGATINMDGAAVTITVMSLAVAHTMGIEVSFMSALFLCVIAALGACGTSGVAGGSLLLIPMACSFFGITNDVAMQAVAIGFIIDVVQDSVETALNSSGDVLFTVTAEMHDRMKKVSGSPFGF